MEIKGLEANCKVYPTIMWTFLTFTWNLLAMLGVTLIPVLTPVVVSVLRTLTVLLSVTAYALKISSLCTHYFTATLVGTILHSLTMLKWVALQWAENWKAWLHTACELTLNCAWLPCTALSWKVIDHVIQILYRVL